ncbi:hypothetical protein BDB01DRAFT_836860 [Pilobolus umbonatus]|nr:hypothetical protein BDB01DRAFT_836860 [Pilobolus umbonatus]
MSTLSDLPQEIIALICSLLDQPSRYNCILVNQEFYAASISELWREPQLKDTLIFKNLIRCLNLSKQSRGDYIRVINLSFEVGMTDDDLLHLLPLVPNLEVLQLKNAEGLTDKSIRRVSSYCTQLKSFGLTGASITYRSAHYLGRCQLLQRLTLASCLNLSPLSLLPFVELPIEHLDLSGCKWLNVSDTAYDLCLFQYLTHLNLVCCDMVSQEFIHYLTVDENKKVGLPNLQDFSITGGTVIDDSVIIPFIKTHSQIRGLFLLECAITNLTLECIALYLPHLHNLDLSFCCQLTAEGVRHLITNCGNLRLLGLKNCELTQTDFPEIPHSVLSISTQDYPYLNTLSDNELEYIRTHQEEEERSNEEGVNEERAELTVVMEEDSVIVIPTIIKSHKMNICVSSLFDEKFYPRAVTPSIPALLLKIYVIGEYGLKRTSAKNKPD